MNNKDKKNENKEVNVNDFLPSNAAIAAIKYSMLVDLFSYCKLWQQF